jgi:hypothetical protein
MLIKNDFTQETLDTKERKRMTKRHAGHTYGVQRKRKHPCYACEQNSSRKSVI